MKEELPKYVLCTLIVLLLVSSASFARETNLPQEPLTVPIGETNKLWGMSELVPGEPGGEVQYTAESFPNTFNNLLGKKKESKAITKMIMGAGLTGVSPVSGRIVPAFAKSWSLSEDKQVYTFHLRRGLKFSDGQPLTAKDVVFTYEELIFNPAVENERRDILRINGELPEIELVDQLTVKFKLPEPHGPFPRRVSTGIYPKHKFEGVTGEEFNAKWNREIAAENPEEIVGAGPFQLEKFVPGEEIVMTRNSHYYKVDLQGAQLPYLNRYRVVKVKDHEVELLKFASDETDFLRPRIRDMPYLLSHEEEEDWDITKGEGTRSGPLNADFLTFNWNVDEKALNELFRKPDFRRAVYLAIDTEEIVEKVFNGFGRPQSGPISRLSPYHKSNMEELLPDQSNSEEARKLLDELEVRDTDDDGVRELNTGNPAKFSIVVNRENQVRTKTAEIVAERLENVGLKVNIAKLNFDKYSSRLIQGNYQSAIASVLANPREPSTLSDIFTTEGPLHFWNLGQSRVLTQWEKKTDRLFRKGLKATDFPERRKYYDEFQEIFAEKLPVIYLPGESFLYAADSSVRNWKEFNQLGTFRAFAEFIWVKE